MKNSIRMFTTVAVLTLGLASFGVAQMMSGNHEHASTDKGDSQSQSGMMNMGKMGMMKDMSDNFDKLQTHFESMMQIDDINTLKAEMKNHQEMMQSMRDNMSEHQAMCMKMMGSDGKMDGKMGKMGCGMMGQGNKGSTN